jgi:prophage DNA circulation protein
MSSLLSQLLPASFRGVSFYCAESSVESGRKQVTHEFPNSDRRFVEDLGRFQNIFKIRAIVSGDNYIAARDALQAALEQPGIGLLVHPFFGNINVVAKPYTLTESLTSLGEAIFQLTFEKCEENIYPTGSVINLSRIFSFADNALFSFVDDITGLFNLIGSYPNNFLDALNLINRISDAFGVNTAVFTQAVGAINKFSGLLRAYERSANLFLYNPTELATQTMGLFQGVDDLIEDPRDRLNTYSRFYDFYENEIPVPPTTFERIQRQNNRDALIGAIRGGSLIQSYRTAPQIEFDNIRELNETQELLEEQYQRILDDDRISNNTKYKIQDLRTEVRRFFEAERLNVNDIYQIETRRQPLRTLAYQYYGSTENMSRLANLNSIIENNFVEGPVDILTS